MGDLTPTSRLLFVAKSVLRSPLSLVIWAAGIVGVFALDGNLLPIAGAAAAQVGLLGVRLRDEEYLRRLFQERSEREQTLTEQQIESSLEQMDFETRQRIRYVLQLQKEITREARASDVEPYARQELDRIASRLPALVQQAMRIAARKQQLTKYLNHVDDRALRSYAENLRRRVESATDPVTKKQYEQALKARETELGSYGAIAQASGRIDSQLENVEATFASWKAKVIRLKTVDIGNVASYSEGLVQELDSLGREIELLDTSVTEALAPDQSVFVGQGTAGSP